MSETREVYDVTMQPGPELDALVEKIIGGIPTALLRRGEDGVRTFTLPFPYSTDPAAAMEAWAWLEENNPWQPRGVALQRSRGKPAVYLTHYDDITLTTGETYPHAIALAVAEAGEALGRLTQS